MTVCASVSHFRNGGIAKTRYARRDREYPEKEPLPNERFVCASIIHASTTLENHPFRLVGWSG